MQDPWKHRAAGMRCATCMWFVPKVRDVPEPKEEKVSPDLNQNWEFGRCRRHAPTMNGYPAVFGNDWCGDHKLDEEKI